MTPMRHSASTDYLPITDNALEEAAYEEKQIRYEIRKLENSINRRTNELYTKTQNNITHGNAK